MALRKNSLFALIAAATLFSGCSKNVFQPELVVAKKKLVQAKEEKQVFVQHKEGVTYKDGTFLTQNGILASITLPKGFAFINETDDVIIAADLGGNVALINKNDATQVETIALDERVLSAGLKGELLAVVDTKNVIKIYDLRAKELHYKYEGLEVTAADIRLANPYFYKGLIFIPTLDGKVRFYQKESNSIVRELSVSSADEFNNVIFLHVNEEDNSIYVATATKLLRFAKETKQKKMPIRNVVVDKRGFLVFTKDGLLRRFDSQLNELQSLKLKFAHYLGMIQKDKLYIAEKEGYIIEVANDLSNYLVFKLDFDAGYFFATKDRFYFQNGTFAP